MEDKGATLPTLISWSMWGVAYAVISGVRIVGTIPGTAGRLGWVLDNADGQAKQALDEWRSGVAVVNGRALVDAHSQLMDEVHNVV